MLSPTEFILSIGSESVLFAHKADLLLKREETEEALELCEQGVKRFPFYAEGYVQLARCYQMLERDEQAVEAYKKALAFQPGHSKALKGLAYLYYKMREKEAGERMLLSAYLYDPFDQELHEFLESEGLLTKIYTTPNFANESEEEDKSEGVALDLEEILDDSRLTPEDERQNIIEKIDEISDEAPEDRTSSEALTDLDASKLEEELAADTDSHFDLDADLDDDFETDFFPEDLSELAPGVGDISEEENSEETIQEASAISEQIDQGRSDVQEGENFSKWMDDLFQSDEASAAPEAEPAPESTKEEARQDQSAEAPAEEPLFDEETPNVLDTALIFNERRKSELQDQPQEEEAASAEDEQEKPVADFNTLEEDIERISTQDAAKIEQSMIEPKSETSEELDEVIKRIQESTEKKKDESGVKQLEFDRQQAKAVEEDAVNIDDILNNPSLLTPTFGEILIAQRKFEDALKVFKALIKKEPDNLRYRKKIEFLSKLVSIKK